jgi:succinate dehydrogenase / fumarate reductase cytochrome b subunit
MILSGFVILFFAIYHLGHFTVGVKGFASEGFNDRRHLASAGHEVHDVYSMVVRGFSNPIVAGVYVVAQLFLAAHLSHGVSSVFKTLGLVDRRNKILIGWIGPAFGMLVAAGNIAIVVACLTGAIPLV